MKRRVLTCALSLSLAIGTAIVSSCTPSGDQNTTASADRKGSAISRGLYAKPKIERHESGARVNPLILSESNRQNTRLVIDVADQKGYLLVNGKDRSRDTCFYGSAWKVDPARQFQHVGSGSHGKNLHHLRRRDAVLDETQWQCLWGSCRCSPWIPRLSRLYSPSL
jgi:hypothetical protein